MKSTKKALTLSVLSLVLCFTMLLGTTYAWFTDSVTSGVNQIVAGNLDIDVQYSKDGESWASLQNSEDVFNDEALWEPGYTEYVYFKVINKGTLAFNYKALVTPVVEKGGVNVNGDSFKLSDYLVFGTTAISTTPVSYADRNAAREAVGTAQGLKVNSLTKTGTFLKGGDDQYFALVVYMPETVGNEANYKTGTTAPKIELAIKFIATQLTSESDSFGIDYDANAVTMPAYVIGAAYDYFPQVSKKVEKADSGATEISVSGKLNKDDTVETELVKATVPADAIKEGVDELTVTVKPQEAAEATTTNTALSMEIENADREVVNFDIKIEGIRENNTVAIPMELFVGKGLNDVKVYHKGSLISDSVYSSNTGIVSFNATTFSDYSVAYDTSCAYIGSETYGTIAAAAEAAENNATIRLLKDVTLTEKVIFSGEKTVTLDLNGKTVTINNNTDDGMVVENGANLILTNSFGEYGKYVFNTTSTKYDGIFVHASTGAETKLTIKNPVEIQVNNFGNSVIHAYGESGKAIVDIEEGTKVITNRTIKGGDQWAAIQCLKNAEINMKGGEVSLNADFDKYSATNDVVGIMAWGNGATVNVTGGKFNVSGNNAFVQGIQVGNYYGSTKATVNVSGGEITLAAGEKGEAYAFTAYYGNTATYNIGNCDVRGTLTSLTSVYSGKMNMTITGGTFSAEPEADYVANGYRVEENNGIYSLAVSEAALALQALTEGGTATISEPMTMDAPDPSNTDRELVIYNPGTVNLVLNNTITSGNLSGYTWGNMRINKGSTLVVDANENGKFINTASNAIFNIQGGNLTINNGYFESEATIINAYSEADKSEVQIVINGGTFKGTGIYAPTLQANTQFIFNPDKLDASHIHINGGSFYNWDPTPFLSSGHTVSSETVGNDTIYTVH